MSNNTFDQVFGGSQSTSNYNATPTNLQNTAYSNLAPGVAQGLSQLFSGGGPAYLGVNSALGSNIFNPAPASAGYTSTNNPLVAPLTGAQTGLVNQAVGQGAPSPQLQQSGGVLSNMLNPNYAASLATSPQTLQAVSAAVNPLVTAFQNTTMPGLQGQFMGAGQAINPNAGPANPAGGSSAFDKAAALAGTGLGENIGSTASNIENAAYQTGLQQQSQAINQAQTLSSTELNNTINSLSAAALPQMIAQYGINQGLSLFQSRIQTMLQSLGLGGQISQPVVANMTTGQSQGTSTPGITGDMNNSAAAVMSDRSTKTDIARIGTADNGLPIYSFRYSGDPVTRLGFMADEVERVRPDAVVTLANGLKMVNYARAVL